mmetsp:Transcript_37799/g.33837  ORF Transcript_37799/g.33837 Transcript_37799/m.33837 type:complete len:166 (-) Transcript_37799:127-624(-)
MIAQKMPSISQPPKSILHIIALLVILAPISSVNIPFPSDFQWGASTAAYQVEGAWNISGKGPNIWDYLTTVKPDLVKNNDSGRVADDFYHHYPDDIERMKTLGIQNFRMSIAWSRVLPNGTSDQPNQAGVDYYNDIFSRLIDAGITPWVTLYHWDLPQALNNFTA